MQRAERQQRAVQAVREMGGWVKYDFEIQLDEHGNEIRDPEAVETQNRGRTWLRTVLGRDALSDVVDVMLSQGELSNADLAVLRNFHELERLFLAGHGVTDAGLVHLQGLKRLKRITFSHTGVSEEGAKHLQQALPNCQIAY